jgi:hypothetical protein
MVRWLQCYLTESAPHIALFRRYCNHVLVLIAMKRPSAIPIRDRRSQSHMTPPVGWGFLRRSKVPKVKAKTADVALNPDWSGEGGMPLLRTEDRLPPFSKGGTGGFENPPKNPLSPFSKGG